MAKNADQARAIPGEAVECRIRASIDGASRIIDICYLAGGIFGGRFYAASRKTTPAGSRIVLRLKEAWGVREDQELAARLGTSQATVSRANQRESVPASWLVKTFEETDFSLDWLLTGQGFKRRI
ncbi:hypothetical protein C4J81_16495 [Deltaproteobacteria bacterium Smac51]|nr:hypothetical protein C4J81_16495 [Deltaproteobacteria bacterium Smac51]